jgi:AcrR family transcriptional regulator
MKRAIKTREKLLDAAVDLFAANGFGGTSIRDIARMTDMTIPNIYYHFGSKEGLLIAILERATRQIVAGLEEVVARTDLQPLERFKLLLKTHFDLLVNVGRKEADILFLEEEHVSRVRKPFQIELMNMYRGELRGLQTLGYVNQKNLTVLAFNIFGVINWHLRWYKPDGKMTLDEIKEEMVSFVLFGMSGVPRAQFPT